MPTNDGTHAAHTSANGREHDSVGTARNNGADHSGFSSQQMRLEAWEPINQGDNACLTTMTVGRCPCNQHWMRGSRMPSPF